MACKRGRRPPRSAHGFHSSRRALSVHASPVHAAQSQVAATLIFLYAPSFFLFQRLFKADLIRKVEDVTWFCPVTEISDLLFAVNINVNKLR